ncbi:MFS transporter [Streptomyces sp. NPDC051207]|uniref:MFS transporter n=1 Tax=Streptomyces sp. NPDC051207 TaxID=3154641 RepID=UPI003412C417
MRSDSADTATSAAPGHVSYSDLFRTREFTPFFLAASAQGVARTMGGLALGTLVYRATDSPLLSAVSMFGASLAQVLGATLLLSAADRLPPRAAMTSLSLAFAAATALMAVPSLPIWGIFAVLLVMGLVASVGGGVRWGLLNEILTKDGYLIGRSVFNMMSGVTQIAGFAAGGALLAVLSPRAILLLSVTLYATAAATLWLGLRTRPPRATGRPSPQTTWRTNAWLWSSAPRRHIYLALWIPNGLVVGCESLYVPYAPQSAGALFACGALGMLIGDVLVARVLPPKTRSRLGIPLLLLLATPYLLFALRPPILLSAVLVTVASVGFGASLIQQERLLTLTPPTLTGHALGLHSSGMLTMQGVSATLAGTLAQLTSPAWTMTALAAASAGVTGGLAVAMRRERPTGPDAAGRLP